MTRSDFRSICTALAFVAVTLGEKQSPQVMGDRKKIIAYAELIEAFCKDNSFSDDTEAKRIDAAIDRHIKELRTDNETTLPEDKAALIKLYDRLQQRKSRRSALYLTMSAEELADIVLKHMDEEIDDAGTMS